MLSVQSVSLFYGAAQALDDVSLDVPAGSVTGVIGRNGVGKTSLLKAIVGLQPVSDGAVTLDGKALDRAAPFDRARAGIAYVPQGREIFPLLTVKENLETGYACNETADRTVPDFIFELFPVLSDMMQRRGGDLSGGQQQQLAIGRALVTRPKVLILDEPTEGIQPSIIQDIGRAIRYLRETAGIAILLVEQYLDFVKELADGVHVMDRGQIVFSGEAADLDKDSVRRHLVV
ncbi:MAG: urea ABC transporter ATP-binding subunit UrtE [Pseudomonadota bacterium]